MNEWIKVKDRLPEKNKDVLCYCDDQMFNKHLLFMIVEDYEEDRDWQWSFQYDLGKVEVISWMELPNPPDE